MDLARAQPEARATAKILAMLPKATAAYRRHISKGLNGDVRAALKARVILRDLPGPISLEPGEDGSPWANYRISPQVLVNRTAW